MTSHCLQFLKQFEMKLMRENVLKVSRQLLRMILYEYDAIDSATCARAYACVSLIITEGEARARSLHLRVR